MMPNGRPTSSNGSQPLPTSFMRSNSGLLGGQGGGMPSQSAFPSMMSPRNQLANMHMLGNMSNVSSLLPQSFANGGQNPGISGLGGVQRGLIDNVTETDSLSSAGNGMNFNAPSSPFLPSNANASVPVQWQQFSNPSVNQMLANPQEITQLDHHSNQQNQQPLQQFPTGNNTQQQQQQQQQVQSNRAGVGSRGLVKLEPQVTNDQIPQQLQALRNLGSVKPETQQLQTMRPVKLEPHLSDSQLFPQQQQQFLHVSRHSPQAAAAAQLLHQQRQQLLTANSQQITSQQPQFQTQNLHRSAVKPFYEPGMCGRRLTHYMYQQQHRPEDNNIGFWKKFVAEYFAPNAKKRWCVSLYGIGRQTTGIFPQDIWHCEICKQKPGRGFEASVEVLPRLFKMKYESGTLEELLFVDMPKESQNSSGQIVLDYAKAVQESVFEQLRVVRDGHLRIVFSQDLKICSWEFCARRHEELIPRRLLIPQVNQLGAAAQRYQATAHNAPSVPELQNNCNMFVSSARQLAKTLEVPLVNDLGYTKRYIRYLQISEVVNSMKDLIDFSRESGIGPMESLAKFPRRRISSSGIHGQSQQPEDQAQQSVDQNHNVHTATTMQLPCSNGIISNVNNMLNSVSVSGGGGNSGLLHHQNSMNSRQQNSGGANSLQMPSPSSSSTHPQTQPNPSSFQSPTTPCSSNMMNDTDANDSQSSVQKIIHEMMMTSQLGGGMMGVDNELKNVNNGMLQSTTNNNNFINRNGSNNGVNQTAVMVNGIRVGLSNNSATLNARVGMNHQHDYGSQLLISGLGAATHGFNNPQFDWKSSP